MLVITLFDYLHSVFVYGWCMCDRPGSVEYFVSACDINICDILHCTAFQP